MTSTIELANYLNINIEQEQKSIYLLLKFLNASNKESDIILLSKHLNEKKLDLILETYLEFFSKEQLSLLINNKDGNIKLMEEKFTPLIYETFREKCKNLFHFKRKQEYILTN